MPLNLVQGIFFLGSMPFGHALPARAREQRTALFFSFLRIEKKRQVLSFSAQVCGRQVVGDGYAMQNQIKNLTGKNLRLKKIGQSLLAVSISQLKLLLILDLIPIKQLVLLWPSGEHSSQGWFPTYMLSAVILPNVATWRLLLEE
jgi:hypothetical protein